MNLKILVADDDFDNRTILTQALEAAHYDVYQATNGQEALTIVAAQKPDIVFMDLSMPEMDGWEATKRIRAIPTAAETPIIAFTAHALQGDETKARAAGCDGFVTKPCVPREIVARVQEWERHKNARSLA